MGAYHTALLFVWMVDAATAPGLLVVFACVLFLPWVAAIQGLALNTSSPYPGAQAARNKIDEVFQ